MADQPPELLIVWWSVTGASQQLAQAACDAAASEPNARVRMLRCDQCQPTDLLAAAGYLFIGPENLGSMAGMMKDLFDRCYYPVLDRIAGRPYAQMVSAGSDGQGAARQLARIVTGWRLREAMPAQIVMLHAQTPERILAPKQITAEDRRRAEELGGALAAGLALGIW